MIVACPECGGKVSTTASNCPHCGHARAGGAGAPPPVPEILEGEIVEEEPAPRAAAPQIRRGRAPMQRPRRPVSRMGYSEQESTGALVCGILGLIMCPILSFVAIGIGKRGKPGWILGVVGVVLWLLGILLYFLIFAAVVGTQQMSE